MKQRHKTLKIKHLFLFPLTLARQGLKKEREVITLMRVKDGQTKAVCCLKIFKSQEMITKLLFAMNTQRQSTSG